VVFDLDSKIKRLEELEEIKLQENFWNDKILSNNVFNEENKLKDILEMFSKIDKTISSIKTSLELYKETSDEEFIIEGERELKILIKLTEYLEIKTLLQGEYDNNDVIIDIHPGAGGVESHDWAEMLYNMYINYANTHKFAVTSYDYQEGEEAGIKFVSFAVSGLNAFGLLKGESGVHRLVRISPFDANKRRHTSFASVLVTPKLKDVTYDIREEDIRIDTYRASGAGGQHINKTDSAIRITHFPSGIVVTCQEGRSQIENKEKAMEVLKSKLLALEIKKQKQLLDTIRGDKLENEWGSQIRSYVFCPYQLVKDHRSQYETSNVEAVMKGEIDEFIYQYLIYESNSNKQN